MPTESDNSKSDVATPLKTISAAGGNACSASDMPRADRKAQQKANNEHYMRVWEFFNQRYFEQSCSLDKQLLWFSGACIGLPLAYFAEKDLSLFPYHLFPLLVAAWAFLIAAIVLVIWGMVLGNEGIHHLIQALDKERSGDIKGKDEEEENGLKCSKKSEKWAVRGRWALVIGGLLLMAFFTFDVYEKIRPNKQDTASKNVIQKLEMNSSKGDSDE